MTPTSSSQVFGLPHHTPRPCAPAAFSCVPFYLKSGPWAEMNNVTLHPGIHCREPSPVPTSSGSQQLTSPFPPPSG